MISKTEKATFAAGCFWGVQKAFSSIPGVIATHVGYTGGHVANPSYEDVCTDKTGHAEAIEIEFDPQQVSYQQLLKKFWEIHNPTTRNQQGVDIGSQYRSAIFYHTPSQQAAAVKSKEELTAAHHYQEPIVTEIQPATKFYQAEDYHQHYLLKRNHR